MYKRVKNNSLLTHFFALVRIIAIITHLTNGMHNSFYQYCMQFETAIINIFFYFKETVDHLHKTMRHVNYYISRK